MTANELSREVISAAIAVHKELGPGLLESAYHNCLAHELGVRGLNVKSEVPMPIVYKEMKLEHGYRLDLLIEDKLVVEIKAVEAFTDVHLAQTLTYLKLAKCKLGLLLNFNVVLMKHGIRRVIR